MAWMQIHLSTHIYSHTQRIVRLEDLGLFQLITLIILIRDKLLGCPFTCPSTKEKPQTNINTRKNFTDKNFFTTFVLFYLSFFRNTGTCIEVRCTQNSGIQDRILIKMFQSTEKFFKRLCSECERFERAILVDR